MQAKDKELEQLRAENAKLKEEKKSTWQKYVIEAVKYICISAGSIAVFFMITKPESEISRQATQIESEANRDAKITQSAMVRFQFLQEILAIENLEERKTKLEMYAASFLGTDEYVDFLNSHAQLTIAIDKTIEDTNNPPSELIILATERNVELEAAIRSFLESKAIAHEYYSRSPELSADSGYVMRGAIELAESNLNTRVNGIIELNRRLQKFI